VALALNAVTIGSLRATAHYYQLPQQTSPSTSAPAMTCRCLAGFESDPTRAAAMHKRRAKVLQPLDGQLNPQHFLGPVRSVQLELGNIWREVAELSQDAGKGTTQVCLATAASRSPALNPTKGVIGLGSRRSCQPWVA